MSLDDHLSDAARRRLDRVAGRGAKQREDWRQRTDQEEEDLNLLFASFFAGTDPRGSRILEYLRSITQGRVLGPDTTNEQLRHLEGARWLFAIIERHVARGRLGPNKGAKK